VSIAKHILNDPSEFFRSHLCLPNRHCEALLSAVAIPGFFLEYLVLRLPQSLTLLRSDDCILFRTLARLSWTGMLDAGKAISFSILTLMRG
jgi:hypothetical protein